MKKNILFIGGLLFMFSCDRFSRVMDDAKKEDMKQNARVYGEVGGPARQSKKTYPAASNAAEKSAKVHDLMFGKGKPAQDSDPQTDTASKKSPAPESAPTGGK